MKLLRAKFENFRLLRDLEINFSSDSDRKLTVIRAANESGKTTILNALQWALYGDEALPNEGKRFRLSPLDWDSGSATIAVTVEFEVVKYIPSQDGQRSEITQYRLIRTVSEDANSVKRSESTVKLYEITNAGADPISHYAPRIEKHLPQKLREVFFTDGDRALSFIEADTKTKRQRVEQAIRSLLGLDDIEAAQRHIDRTEAAINKRLKEKGIDIELQTAISRLEEIDAERETLEEKLAKAKEQIATFKDGITETDNQLQETLKKGDKEELSKSLTDTKEEIKQIDADIKSAAKRHAELFKSLSIAQGLLTPVLSTAFEKLEELHIQGKIPSATIPVLRDRLESEICICGESLASNDKATEHRRKHIERLIEESREADQVIGVITNLYYNADAQISPEGKQVWPEQYKEIIKERENLAKKRAEKNQELDDLEKDVASLKGVNTQGLRDKLKEYRNQLERFIREEEGCEAKLEAIKREKNEFEQTRDKLLRGKETHDLASAELDVVRDLKHILNSAFGRIMDDELSKVSKYMNDIFLEMIVADKEQRSIIRRAEITKKDFDIIVYGPEERTLDPDTDLNGASRRALTLSFILALTKVSGVIAPNVIDTPLGMTSGQVRRSILKTAIRESSQLILFLTHDEIKGCEDIIDKEAGRVFTLTNTDHYPTMLMHKPKTDETKTVVCECDHRKECKVCQRIETTDDEQETDTRGVANA